MIIIKRKNLILHLLIVILVFCVISCASITEGEAVEKILWSAGTTGEGSTGYVGVGTMSELINRYVKDYIQMTPIANTTSVVGLKAYDKGEVDSMYASMQQLDLIMKKTGVFSTDLYKWSKPISQMVWMYAIEWYAIIRSSDKEKIKNWSDLKGKKILPQMKGTSTYEIMKIALGPDGINIWDTLDIKQFHRSHAADALKSGEIDVVIGYGVGTPAGWVQEVITRCDIVILAPTSEELKKIIASAPYISSSELDPSVFGKNVGLETKVSIPACGYVYIVDPDIEEEYVYLAVKTLFEHKDELLAVAPALWKSFSANPLDYNLKYLKDAVDLGVPLHKGFKRYLKELGCDLKSLGLE